MFCNFCYVTNGKTYAKIGWLNNRSFYILRFFHNSVCWRFFTGVLVTASFVKSPELFSVFWLISTIWIHFPNLCRPSKRHKEILSSITFLSSQTKCKYLSFFAFLLLSRGRSTEKAKSTWQQVLFFVNWLNFWSSGWDSMIRLYLKISHKFKVSLYRKDSGLSIYHLVVWSRFNLFHNCQ